MKTYFEGPPEEVTPPPVVPIPTRLVGPLRALYLVAFFLAVVPIAEIFPKLWPFEPLAVTWRYGAFGILSSTLLAPTLAIVAAATLAGILNDRRVQSATAVLATVVGVLLVLGDLEFVVDYARIRGAASVATRGAIDSSAWRAMFVGALSASVLITIGIVGWRSADTPPPGTLKKKGNRVGLVIAQRAERAERERAEREGGPLSPR